MGRKLAHDPEYNGRLIRLPMDFYKVLRMKTQWIPEDQWRIYIPGYYKRCLAKAKANPLVTFDTDVDVLNS